MKFRDPEILREEEFRNFLKTGLFEELTLTDHFRNDYLKLKDSDFYIFIWAKRYDSNATLWRKMSLLPGFKSEVVSSVSFEEVLNSVSDEVKEKLIYHLDLL